MDEKLVSVIIPAYNIEDYIGRCLDSVISQTYKNLEIIVVDDGSGDRTAKILDDYKEKDCRIKVIHKKNSGVSSARNKGLDIASGDYIGFVDGDDLVDVNLYETLVKLIEEGADIAHCGYQMVFPNRVDYYYNTGKKKIQTTKEGLKDLLSGEMIEPALYNKLYRKELFNNIRLNENLKINEDLEINYKLFKKSKKSIYYDLPLYSYMIRKNSATSSNTIIRKNEDSFNVLREIKNDSKNDKEVYAIAYRRYIYLLMAICRMEINQKEYQYLKRNVLKQELKMQEFKEYISLKLRVMSGLACYFPGILRCIYKLYDLKTGTSRKYTVDEE